MARNWHRRMELGRRQEIATAIQGANGTLVYWDMQNQPPDTWTPAWNRAKSGVLPSLGFPGPQLIDNNNFDNWTADDPDDWTVVEVGDATSNVTENPANQCQMISDITNVSIAQILKLTVGDRFGVNIAVTAVASGELTISDSFGAGADRRMGAVGQFSFFGDAIITSFLLKRQVACDVTVGVINVKAANPLDADITSVTIGQPGQGNIQYLYQADGVNDLLSFAASGITALDAIFSADPFTLFGVHKVSASGIWTDTNTRTLLNLGVDANNFIKIGSDGAGNFQAQVKSGASATRTLTAAMTTDELFSWVLTRTGNNLELFIDKVSVDTDTTGLNAWAGTLAQNLCVDFAGTLAGSEFFSGSGAYRGIADQVWSQGDINVFHDSLGI